MCLWYSPPFAPSQTRFPGVAYGEKTVPRLHVYACRLTRPNRGTMKYFWLLGTCALLAISVRAQTTDKSADVPPVMLATLFSDAAAVEELLKQGADPNQAD